MTRSGRAGFHSGEVHAEQMEIGDGDIVEKIQLLTETIDAANVTTNTISQQSFDVSELSSNDIVTVNPPSGLGIGVTGTVKNTGTLELTFTNPTGSGIDPSSGDYLILAVRKQ